MPSENAPRSAVSLPSHVMGRLIGKRGAIIQELEKSTGCRVLIPPRSSDEASVFVTIYSVSSRNADEALMHEARCVRVAQLLCLEGLPLADALGQADAERQAQEEVEAASAKKEQEKLARRRILVSWPQFEEADAEAALREAFDDEDAAIDLLLGGFRAPVMKPSLELQRSSCNEQDKVKEEYPSLPADSNSVAKPPPILLGSQRNANRWERRRVVEDVKVVEAFPSLPASRPLNRKPSVNTAQAARKVAERRQRLLFGA